MIIADTHAWVWWTSVPRLLSKKATEAFGASPEIGVASISCWEIATLVQKGRIELDRDPLTWIKQALAQPKVRLLNLTPEIAVTSSELATELPGDPADRIIAATASIHRAALVTKDMRLRKSASLATIW